MHRGRPTDCAKHAEALPSSLLYRRLLSRYETTAESSIKRREILSALARRPTPAAQRHPAGNADPEDVKPAVAEIEQERVEQRSHHVLHHDDEPQPRHQAAVAEQGEMRDPEREQYD